MPNKISVIAMRLHPLEVTISGSDEQYQVDLPNGCKGLLLVFESKKKAKEYFGNKVSLQEVTIEEDKSLWTY